MTNDKQEEVWRKEFESNFSGAPMAKDELGNYKNSHRNSMWAGFLIAKLSMPPIELPKPTEQQIYQWFQESTIAHHIEEDGSHIKKRDAFLAQKAIQFAITAAGYKWEVKK